MDAISLLRIQLQGSFSQIVDAVKETSDEEWVTQASEGQNPPGFTLWHCVRSIDWAINCAIQGLPEVAAKERWRGMLASTAWFGYEVSMETARKVAAAVSQADVIAYAGEVEASAMSWLEGTSEDQLDVVPDLARHYSSNGMYASSPRLEAWIKEDAETPVWQHVAGACIGHVRRHLGEVQALNESLRSRVST